MATYFVDGAKADDAGAGTTWTAAKKTIAGALAVAAASGDVVVIKRDGLSTTDSEVTADRTYAALNNIAIIAADYVSGGDDKQYTPAKMNPDSYWIGNSSASRFVSWTGGYAIYLYGLVVRQASTSADSLIFGPTAGSDTTLDGCYLWLGGSSSSTIDLGSISGANEHAITLIDTVFRFGHVSQGLSAGVANVTMHGCSISPDGTTPTYLFQNDGTTAKVLAEACDFSNVGTALIENQAEGHKLIILRQCKVPSSILASQTTYGNRSQAEVFAYDCASSNIHYSFIYANTLGELTVAVGGSEPYITADGASYDLAGSKSVWKIVTTSAATFYNPFVTPWISVHHEPAGAITPYIEAMRKDSTSVFLESQLWSEWMYKGNTGSTQGKLDRSDAGPVAEPSTSNQGASSLTSSDWANAGATPAFMKLAPTSPMTIAEIGDLCGRICVGVAGTIYVDPTIRGRS